jgi:hypothetical protein
MKMLFELSEDFVKIYVKILMEAFKVYNQLRYLINKHKAGYLPYDIKYIIEL